MAVPLNFKSTSKLPFTQKIVLTKLTGLDFNQMSLLFKNRPVAIFVDDPELDIQTAENFIKKLIKKKPEIKNYTWIYKNHPGGV